MKRFVALDFHDFSQGVEIDDSKINNWINEVLNDIARQIESREESPLSLCSSGNTTVWAWQSDDSIELFITDKYKVAHIDIEDLGIKK